MKWIQNGIIFSTRKTDWNIYLSQVSGYQLFEITDPISRGVNLPLLYLTLLDYLFKEYPTMILSQFIDESQGMLDDKDRVLSELPERHGVKIAITENFSSTNQPPNDCREYVLNVIGKPDSEWLKKVIAYGGTSLSNIIYSANVFGSDWLEVTAKRNQIFIKWYWLETGDEELIGVRQEVKMMCWTSDTHINILIEKSQVEAFLASIEAVAGKHSLTVKIHEKQ